jgi:hypothetical protein
MHAGGTHGAGATHAPTQAEADTCCAASEQDSSNSPVPPLVTAVPAAVLNSGVVLPQSVPSLVLRDSWRTVLPFPTRPVPTYVLLSVFLI